MTIDLDFDNVTLAVFALGVRLLKLKGLRLLTGRY
jgi:hypothetical protein